MAYLAKAGNAEEWVDYFQLLLGGNNDDNNDDGEDDRKGKWIGLHYPIWGNHRGSIVAEGDSWMEWRLLQLMNTPCLMWADLPTVSWI